MSIERAGLVNAHIYMYARIFGNDLEESAPLVLRARNEDCSVRATLPCVSRALR